MSAILSGWQKKPLRAEQKLLRQPQNQRQGALFLRRQAQILWQFFLKLRQIFLEQRKLPLN